MRVFRRGRDPRRTLLLGSLVAALVAVPVPATGSAPSTGELVGRVTTGGQPVGNALVTLTPLTPRGEPLGPPQLRYTDTSGRYRFADVPDGSVKVQARGPLFGDLADVFWPAAYSFASARTIGIADAPVTADLELPRGGSAEGRVLDAASGTPVVGARVTAQLPGDPPGEAVGAVARSSRAGGFALSNLPPVELRLRVELPAGSPHLPPTGDPGDPSEDLLIDGAAASSGLVITLRRGAVIRGTVTDDAGAPLAGARVRLVGCSTCPEPTTTDASGAYRLRPVPPGTGMRVVAVPGQGLLGAWFPGSGSPTPIGREVAAGDVVDEVDITLTRGAFLTVEVSPEHPEDPVPAVVQLIGGATIHNLYVAPGGDADTGSSATDGRLRVRVGPVPPGEYAVRIRAGLATIGKLPTRWVSTESVEATPTLRLAAGEEATVAVRMGAPQGSGGDPAVARVGAAPDPAPGPQPSGGWPGLRQGFLAPGGGDGLSLS